MKSSNKHGRNVHHCPKVPAGWVTVTGPAWCGESLGEARRMWEAWRRTVARAAPMPRTTQ